MPGLYNWFLNSYEVAHGFVYGHPRSRLSDGKFIRTSLILDMAVIDGTLVLITFSGSEYHLRLEEIDPNRTEATAENLAFFGIGAGFVEDCLQARREADARLRDEEERLVEPGELLLATMGNSVIRNLFRTAGGTPVSVKPFVHGDSRIPFSSPTGRAERWISAISPESTAWNPITSPTACGPSRCATWASGLCTSAKQAAKWCAHRGEITTIPAAELDCEGLFSPDAVNGTGLYKTMLSNKEGETDDK